MIRALRIFGAAFVALLFLAACGDDDEVSESDAVELLTEELVTGAQLPQADAECVSEVIIGEIGVDGLEDIGLQTGGSGDFTDLSTEQQDRLFDLITDSFATCEIEAN